MLVVVTLVVLDGEAGAAAVLVVLEIVEVLVVVEDLVDSLKMYCRGGDGCCGVGSTRLCLEGEGDCDHDDQCAGVLECGSDNCATKVRSSVPSLSPHSLLLPEWRILGRL